jgi:hypothetical protein
MESVGQVFPTTFEVDRAQRIANWRPVVQWLLAIPHFLILEGLQIVAWAAAVIGWFAIVFTGKLPEGLANLLCLNIRYNNRAVAYAGSCGRSTRRSRSTQSRPIAATIRRCAPGSRPSSSTAPGSRWASGSSWPSPPADHPGCPGRRRVGGLGDRVVRGAGYGSLARGVAHVRGGLHALVHPSRGLCGAAHRRVPAVQPGMIEHDGGRGVDRATGRCGFTPGRGLRARWLSGGGGVGGNVW